MADYDLGIIGGEVFVNSDLVAADLWVSGERIAAITAPTSSNARSRAERTIDASGRVVCPGGIDTHTHAREPGYTHKEDFGSASRAAAVGGVTTIIDMPNVEPPTDTVETFQEKQLLAASKSVVDWGHWVAGTKPEEIPKMAAAGATGFKIFQVSGVYPHDPRLALNDEGALLRSFRAIAKTGLPCLVHPFNQSLFEELSKEALSGGRTPDTDAFSDVYTREEVWSTAVNVLLALQRISGTRLHLLHTHSSESLRLIREAKLRGQGVTCEVDPKYFHMLHSDIAKHGGKGIPGGYVTEDEERMAEIWRSLRDGTVNNIATDHAPHTSEEADYANVNAWEAHLGSPQLEWLYALVVNRRRGWQVVTRSWRSTAHRGPGQGRRRMAGEGRDCPWVACRSSDPRSQSRVGRDRRQSADEGPVVPIRRSPFQGEGHGHPVAGQVVAEDGKITAEPGSGQYISGISRPLVP